MIYYSSNTSFTWGVDEGQNAACHLKWLFTNEYPLSDRKHCADARGDVTSGRPEGSDGWARRWLSQRPAKSQVSPGFPQLHQGGCSTLTLGREAEGNGLSRSRVTPMERERSHVPDTAESKWERSQPPGKLLQDRN